MLRQTRLEINLLLVTSSYHLDSRSRITTASASERSAIHSSVGSISIRSAHCPTCSRNNGPVNEPEESSYLAMMANSILDIICDEIDTEGKQKYDVIYPAPETADS